MALGVRQKRFCEEYLVDFNGTQAAIRSGYSVKTAYAIASENLRKPEIKAEIEKRLVELQLSAAETGKMLSDLAKSSLNDYFVISKKEFTPRIQIKLSVYVQQLKEQMKFEEEFAMHAEYNEDEMKSHEASQRRLKRQILRHELELKKNPKAMIVTDGPTEMIEVAELDMVRLVADKEKGRIKSITPGQFGNKVELYAADAALVNVAKIHGLFERDNEQKKPDINIPMNDDQVEKVIAALKTMP